MSMPLRWRRRREVVVIPHHPIQLSELMAAPPRPQPQIAQRATSAQAAIADYVIELSTATILTLCGMGGTWEDVGRALERAINAMRAAHPLSLAALAGAATEADYYDDQDAQ